MLMPYWAPLADMPRISIAPRFAEMKAMPVIPIFHDTWAYLEAPFLRGLKSNPFGFPRFKYAWIDTNWRPS